MALPTAITITLLIGYITFFMNKKFSYLHNSIVFMVMTILTANYKTIMTMELKLLNYSKDSLLFSYLLLDRMIITPLIVVIYINLSSQMKNRTKKVFLFITILGVMQGLDTLMNFYGVIEPIRWKMFYMLFINSGFLLIGLGVSKLLQFMERKGDRYDSFL